MLVIATAQCHCHTSEDGGAVTLEGIPSSYLCQRACMVLCNSIRTGPGVQTCEPRAQVTRRRRRCCSGCCAPAAARTSARSSAGCARACWTTRSPSSWCRRTRRAPAQPAAPAAPTRACLRAPGGACAPACPRLIDPSASGMETGTAGNAQSIPSTTFFTALTRTGARAGGGPQQPGARWPVGVVARALPAAARARRCRAAGGGRRRRAAARRAGAAGGRQGRHPGHRRAAGADRLCSASITPAWLLRLGSCSAAAACVLDQDAPPWPQACRCPGRMLALGMQSRRWPV